MNAIVSSFHRYASRERITLGLSPVELAALIAIMSYEKTNGCGPSRRETEAFVPHSIARALVRLRRLRLIDSYKICGVRFLHTWLRAWELVGEEPPEHLKVPGVYQFNEVELAKEKANERRVRRRV